MCNATPDCEGPVFPSDQSDCEGPVFPDDQSRGAGPSTPSLTVPKRRTTISRGNEHRGNPDDRFDMRGGENWDDEIKRAVRTDCTSGVVTKRRYNETEVLSQIEVQNVPHDPEWRVIPDSFEAETGKILCFEMDCGTAWLTKPSASVAA